MTSSTAGPRWVIGWLMPFRTGTGIPRPSSPVCAAMAWLPPVVSIGRSTARPHKVAGVRKAIEGAGARLIYLPPYSPDLNPIEQAFAKSIAPRQGTAIRRRTLESARRPGPMLRTSRMCQFLRHAGYFYTS